MGKRPPASQFRGATPSIGDSGSVADTRRFDPRLSDLHPLPGKRSRSFDRRFDQWRSSRQNLAELICTSRHYVCCVVRSPGPKVSARAGQFHSDWFIRWLQSAIHVAEVTSDDTQVCNVAQSICPGVLDTEAVGQIVGMRPCFHQPTGRHRSRANFWANPGNAILGVPST